MPAQQPFHSLGQRTIVLLLNLIFYAAFVVASEKLI